MITRIKVDGFKSLRHFSLDVRPGVNILVGPNGSGKTNIINFFEFLSNLVLRNLNEAVAAAGGAGSLFTRVGEEELQRTLVAEILGEIEERRAYKARSYKYLYYIYSFSLKISAERDFVFFDTQRLRFVRTKERIPSDQYRRMERVAWDFDVSYRTAAKFEGAIQVSQINRKKVRTRFLARGRRKGEFVEELRTHLSEEMALDNCFLADLQLPVLMVRKIYGEMVGGEALNIIPSHVKRSEDSSKAPGIEKDGSGLAATLYALRQQKPRVRTRLHRRSYRFFPFFRGLRLSPDSFERIKQHLRLVNTAVVDIEVRNNSFTNALEIICHIEGENGSVKLPFASMSDGTVKWLALITAILTYRSIFAIEEPENYIHPAMQREIVEIMREDALTRRDKAFVIMTTHSETILNAADPREVIVVSMKHGVTQAKRVQGQRQLREEIRRTGFGLGYYYLTGALDRA